MPQPISSNGPAGANLSDDPTLDDAGQVCGAPPKSSQPAQEPLASTTQPAVAKLVSSVPPAGSTLPAATTASNNAERTSERRGVAPYAAKGETADGTGTFAGAALVKGRDRSGFEAEVMSISGQVGSQTELQAGVVRVGGSGKTGSASFETMTARVSAGTRNDDGSKGANFSALAVAVGTEATISDGANSFTLGASVGFGAAASVGFRDADHDGTPELCARLAVGILTVGLCWERPR